MSVDFKCCAQIEHRVRRLHTNHRKTFKWSDRARDWPFVLEKVGGTLNESVIPFAVITQRQKVAADQGVRRSTLHGSMQSLRQRPA